MAVWFAHMRSPLGTSVRIGYVAIIDVGDKEELEDLARKLGSYRLEILCPENLDDLYRASTLDPDAVDTMKSCGNKCCVLVAYAQ
ncbi:MAG: hypothetical protein QXR14_09375 [Sulfolobales archaeon]